MKIEFLGHSEFVLEMENPGNRPVRILCDSWLSGFAFTDFLRRNPVLEIDYDSLPDLDAIYLTHPHCDHFDPYTLVPLFQKKRPAILLPETSLFLKPLLEKYLDRPDIFIVSHDKPFRLFGLNMRGLSYPAPFHSNEDDVMMLFVENGTEAFFYEADSAVPETVEAESRIYELFSSKEYENRVYVATRNELEALFTSYDAKEPGERKRLLKEYRKKRREEMEWEFEKHEEGIAPVPELWQLPDLHRVLIGQGLVFPPEIDPAFLDLSSPYSLAEVASDENRIAKEFGRKVKSLAPTPGQTLVVEKGKTRNEKISWIKNQTNHPVRFTPDLKLQREALSHPLRLPNDERSAAEGAILNALNQRFLPHWLTGLEEPAKQVLHSIPERKYCIEVVYGEGDSEERVHYTFGFDSFAFAADPGWKKKPHEQYFASNLIDVLEGRQDVFSSTIDWTPPGTSLRFWAALGLPFLNSDLVYKKLEFHFERATKGLTVEDWFQEMVGVHFKKGSDPDPLTQP